MDGQQPSGLTDNLYWGIDAICDPKATTGTTCCADKCTSGGGDNTKTDDTKNDDTKTDDTKTDDTTTNDDTTKKDTTVVKPAVVVDTPTGKTNDEILTGPPPENSTALIENFNQLFDEDPGAAIGYLLDNFDVLFKFW